MEDPETHHELFKKPLKRKRSSQGPTPSSDSFVHDTDGVQDGTKGSGVTAFRTVSACNRCRSRKNKCDQALPACGNCEKAGTDCVGYDANLDRSVPRNYVLYLETRVEKLESLLQEHGIPYPPATELAIGARSNGSVKKSAGTFAPRYDQPSIEARRSSLVRQDEHQKKDRLPSGPDRRVSMSAISFASVVREAVRRYIAHGARAAIKGNDGPHHDSFFGLYSPPITRPAPFPEPDLARDLSHLYFEHANPQLPILHRGEFAKFLEKTYATPAGQRTVRALFFVNIVCAIGAGIIMDKSGELDQQASDDEIKTEQGTKSMIKRAEPEQYFAAAMVCLETFMSAPRAIESTPAGLEELQAVLLVANFSLLRPVTPGLWYIAGIAMRLAKNLGLYHEGQDDIDLRPVAADLSDAEATKQRHDRGRLWWSRDMRRRLWYCAYSIDRLTSVCVGRPTSIDETVITTPFPCGLDDRYIGPMGIDYPPVSPGAVLPSYKRVSYHYFRLRLLQSEVLQVLESRRAQLIRAAGRMHLDNRYIPADLRAPYLARFHGDFRSWRADIDARLTLWQREGPRQEDIGVKFDPLFLDLNYWQTMVMLYRHSLSIPEQLAGELDESTLEESRSTAYVDAEDREDEQVVFYKAGVAGQQVLRIYRQLHLKRLVNYTYLATHHIFICGVTFLYSIWQSPLVRQSIKREDIDLTVLAATTVLTALIPKCPPAQNARDAFKRMSKVSMAFYLANKPPPPPPPPRPSTQLDYPGPTPPSQHQNTTRRRHINTPAEAPLHPRPSPQFDTGFKSLFSEEDLALNSPDFPLPRKFMPVFARQAANAQQSQRVTGIPNAASQQQQQQHHPASSSSEARLDFTLDPTLRGNEASPSLHHDQTGQQQQQQQAPYTPSMAAASAAQQRTPGSAYPSDASVGADGAYFDDGFWEYFQGPEAGGDDPTASSFGGAGGAGGAAGGAGDGLLDHGTTAGMGFGLGFGAGALEGPVGSGDAGADWPERGFEMLDGWLLGGTSGG